MNIVITEPMTMLTDYLITIETFIFAGLLIRSKSKSKSLSLWIAAFFSVGVAALCGGTYHGFAFYLQDSTSAILWMGVTYSLSLSSFLMLWATVINFIPSKFHKFSLTLVGFKSLLYLYLARQKDDFRYILADYMSASVAILVIVIFAFYTKKQPSAIFFITGIIILFIAGGVQQSGIILARNFNYNDLSHIISMVAFYLLYKGCYLHNHG